MSWNRSTERYRLFGLTVRSQVQLPLPIIARDCPVDVDVVLGRVTPGPRLIWHQSDPLEFACTRRDSEVILEYPRARISVTPEHVVIDSEALEESAILLMQAAWSVLLTARGREALHAGVVARDGSAIAVSGQSGSGKSTAVLRLLDRGWRLVSDDLLSLDERGNVVTGPPFIRLVPDRAAGREGEWDVHGKLRYWPAAEQDPVPLTALVIHGKQHSTLERLHGARAVSEILANLYNDLLTHEGQTDRRFDMALSLVNSVAVYGAPPRSLTAEQLERVAQSVVVA